MNERDENLIEDFLDGELSGETLRSFEGQLGTELALRHRLDEIRNLRARLEALPTDAFVPGRVWDGVLARIQETPQETLTDIIPLSSAARTSRFGGRVSFSIPQLAAAAVVLVSLGSALTWSTSLGSTQPTPEGRPVGIVPVATAPSSAPVEALFVEYDASAAALMEIIDNGASVLTDETLQVVQESLATIDAAVSEAREALVKDPGSAMLNRILLSNMQKKLDLLRNTAAAVQAIA